ncbi:unnamed protein product [Litomosoides sigmodontis]|uniref:Uncharacterized protein n=1 Tax=Litomosoides sigmodontis TaxID=42156 RepID=A0A3P6VEZ1_LITSI|nr:unnamed protein product [Litomosoides sigmodontis]
METVEDVVDELLNLVEASSKNAVEEFLRDLVQVSSRDAAEESVENPFDASCRKDKIDEILDDLINGTCTDEVEELLDDMAEISLNDEEEEKNFTNMSSKDKINQQLATLMELASSRNGMNQQLLRDLVQVTVNDLIEEILKEMSKVSPFKDSTQASLRNAPEGSATKFRKEESPEPSPMHSSALTPSTSNSTVKFHFQSQISCARDGAVASSCGPL